MVKFIPGERKKLFLFLKTKRKRRFIVFDVKYYGEGNGEAKEGGMRDGN